MDELYLETENVILWVLLDPSALFDPINHGILLHHLKDWKQESLLSNGSLPVFEEDFRWKCLEKTAQYRNYVLSLKAPSMFLNIFPWCFQYLHEITVEDLELVDINMLMTPLKKWSSDANACLQLVMGWIRDSKTKLTKRQVQRGNSSASSKWDCTFQKTN